MLHLFRPTAVNLSPAAVLPHSHADLPQLPAAVEYQTLGFVNCAGRGTGAVEIAGVHSVNLDIRKPPLQSLHLPPATVCQIAVALPLGDPVEIALRLGVADQIDVRHDSS